MPLPTPEHSPSGGITPPSRRSWGDYFDHLARQVSRHKLGVLVTVGLLVMLLSAAMGVVLLEGQEAAQEAIPRLSQVLERLDEGDDLMAGELAQRLRYKPNLEESEITGVAFALGVSRARLADRDFGDDQRRGYLVAARYLESAHQRGWPEGRAAEGLWHLGRSLFRAGKLSRAQAVLEETLPLVPQRSGEIHQMLARTCFDERPPRLAEAISHLDQYLAQSQLKPLDRQLGLIERAEALFLLGEKQRCTETLDELPDDSPAVALEYLLRARLLIDEARGLAGDALALQDPAQVARLGPLYDEATKNLKLALERDTLQTQVGPRAMYLLAVCLREKGDRTGALEQFARTLKLHYESPEGLASSLAEAALLIELDEDEDAVRAYRAALERIPPSGAFRNPWISPEELAAALRTAQQHLVNNRRMDLAIELLSSSGPVLTEIEIAQRKGGAYRAWGKLLLAGEVAASDTKQSAEDEGHLRLRQAGQSYLEVARLLRTTREYPEQLWTSAESLLEGNDFVEAAQVLEEYLATEMRGHRPEALVRLGEALLALERTDEALKALSECIERHPRDAANFTARVLAADALEERGELAEAERLLLENLDGDYLTPQSPEWKASLFLLGRLLYRGGRYEDSVARLEEAVRRYPDDPGSLESNYLIAEAYRHLAHPAGRDETVEVAESTRLAQAKQAEQYLLRALPHYEAVETTIDARQEKLELSSEDDSLLRNTLFARGEILFDLGRYAEAVDAYSTAVNRHPHSPEVLEAYVQIAECYRRLNQPSEARATIEQAKVVLKRLGTNAPYKETTNYTSEGWIQRLEWLSRL